MKLRPRYQAPSVKIPAFLLRRKLRAKFERAKSEYHLAAYAYTHDPSDDTMLALLLAHYTLELARADYLACAGIEVQ